MRYVSLRTNSAEYQKCHRAVREKYGKVTEYECVICGKPARDWAWRHYTDPQDPDNYEPMCRKCHKAYDLPEFIKEERAAKRAEGIRKGWTPERREAQRRKALEQWASGNLSREETSERALRDKPWLGRRPWNGGEAR